jgi:hypothetical protein
MNQEMTGRERAESTVDQADIRGLVAATVIATTYLTVFDASGAASD